jgi:hypothetical protein
MRGRLIAALTRGELKRAQERDLVRHVTPRFWDGR